MGSGIIFTAVLVCSITILTQLPASSAERARRALPCTHPLRIVRPDLFKHCDVVCMYTTWSSWRTVPNSVVSVPKGKCPSEKAYTEERTRTATGSGCTETLRETQSICLPTQEERLILGLGLGGHRNNFDPLGNAIAPAVQYAMYDDPGASARPHDGPLGPRGCPQDNTNGRICEDLPGIGKRSIRNTKNTFPLPKKNKIVHSDIDPIPFDWLEHGPRLRNKRQTTCGDPQSVQHVLFVIDTSGSIGQAQFERVKYSLSLLPVLFCRQVKFAVITFSTYINLEFCFGCFENTFDGRGQVSTAISDIVFRGGNTNTGATARCICEEILQPSCGIEAYPDCLDVVFITDGKSNDPKLEICEEVKCLHNRLGVDTYAIGINSAPGFGQSYDVDELECITQSSDLTSVFEFESFEAFELAIIDIFDRLLQALPNSPESCSRLDGIISPTGAPPFKK